MQQTLYFQSPVTNKILLCFFWLQLCVTGYFPKSLALISITMLAYIWQRKSVTHLKRDEYLCFLLPCLKRRECCSQAMLKPNEKAPPAGRPLPLSLPCVLRVGTVRRFSCGSHRPAYSWLKKKKGGLAGELLDALGPPLPKEKVVKCCLKKKKRTSIPLGIGDGHKEGSQQDWFSPDHWSDWVPVGHLRHLVLLPSGISRPQSPPWVSQTFP